VTPPLAIAPVRFAGSEEHSGDRIPGRVPQRGGNDGEWIDVRPRQRKVRRQKALGQDRLHEGDRLRNKDDFKLPQSRVRHASWEDRYFGEYDTGSDYFDRRTVQWGDREFEEDCGYDSDRSQMKARLHFESRRPEAYSYERSAMVVDVHQQ